MARKAFKIIVNCVFAILLVLPSGLVVAATKTDASQKTTATQTTEKKTKSSGTSSTKKVASKDKKPTQASAKNTKTAKPKTVATKTSTSKTKTQDKKLAVNKAKTTKAKNTKLAGNSNKKSSTKKVAEEKTPHKNKELMVALNPDKKTSSTTDSKTKPSDTKKTEPVTIAKNDDKTSKTATTKKHKDETVVAANSTPSKNKKTGFRAQNLHKGKSNKSRSNYSESIKLALSDLPEESALFAKELKHGVANLAGMVNKTLENMHYTHYQMGGSKFDPSHGIYITDCSGYVNRLLNQVNPAAYFSLVHSTGSSRPNSEDFYNFFNKLAFRSTQHWGKVEDASNLQAGDILVFRHGWHGGHVMVVMNKPIRHNDVLEVRVADSASSGHSRDTRPAHVSGVGVGTMLIKVNSGNQPAAYAWRVGAPWERVRFAMGRPLA